MTAAADTPRPAAFARLSEEEIAAVERVAAFIARMGLTVPAIVSLESMRPLSFVGSQFMLVLSPAIGAFLRADAWDGLSRLLERRDGLDALLAAIERADAAHQAARRAAAAPASEVSP